jgi:phosphoglycerol transferase
MIDTRIHPLKRWLVESDGPWYFLTAGITVVITYFALALYKAKLNIPWLYAGDSLPTGAHFKTVIEEGWYEHQPDLGAPYGQVYNDFPTADNLHMIAAKILALFTHEWPVAINLYFVIGFVLAAITGFWFFRICRINPALSMTMAVLFATAPYHFLRSEGHLWLASYYCVPLGLGLLILILRGESIWGTRPSRYRIVGILTGRGAFSVVAVALLATSSSYYAVFFLVMLAVAGIAVLIRDKSWRRFWGAASIGLVTVAAMLTNMAPDLLYSATAGPNPGGFGRSAIESELYALKLSSLLLPWPGHQIDFLRNIRAAYDSTYPLASERPALGFIAALGFVFAFLLLAYMALSWRKVSDRLADNRGMQTLGYLSALTFVAFLLSTVGGLSTIVSFFTDALRGWNRMSIVIGGLTLAVFGLALQMALAWAFKRFSVRKALSTGLVGLVSVGLLGVGYVDQTPWDGGAGYASIEKQWKIDQDFVNTIEATLPADSMVLELPYLPFPEYASPNGTQSSDTLIPYLHSETLRWSGGGIKGRPRTDWPYFVSQQPASDIVTLAAAADMSGIVIDTRALDENNDDLETGIRAVLGDPVTSSDGRWQFFDIRSVRATLETTDSDAELGDIGNQVTNPIEPLLAPDFGGTSTADLTQGTSSLTAPKYSLVNPRDSSDEITLSMNVSLHGVTGNVDITYPDGTTQTVFVETGGSDVSHTFVVKPGTSYVTLRATASTDTAPVPIQVSEIDAENENVRDFLTR